MLLTTGLVACRVPEAPEGRPGAPVAGEPVAGQAGALGEPTAAGRPPPPTRSVELVLDRGRIVDDGWVSEPLGEDRLVSPAVPVGSPASAQGTFGRVRVTLPYGPTTVILGRACGPSEVQVLVAADDLVYVPYPACVEGEIPLTSGLLAQARRLGVLSADPDAPDEGELPARWLRFDEARALCAWFGQALAEGGAEPLRCQPRAASASSASR